ncbi:histidine kinase [Zhouia spongiae]|uniref:Histidine kinase n=1 Tax=Zhouia spongiae TaxID=2202721 RepID=A0ABY3YQD5_9FLAO|nr:histidine kinase [Zhouia spongiae]UNZ00018.1 histidine kinase [Zhouia spongiae]
MKQKQALSIIVMFLCAATLFAQQTIDEVYRSIKQEVLQTPSLSHSKKIDALLEQKKLSVYDQGRFYFIKGLNYNILNQSERSVLPYRKAIEKLAQTTHYELESKARLNLSGVYTDLKQFTRATTQILTVEELAKAHNDSLLQAKVYEYLSNLLYVQGNTFESLGQLKAAADIYERQSDSVTLSRLYNNMAVLNKNMGMFEDAIAFNNKSLTLSIALKDKEAIAESYNNLGVNYENMYNWNNEVSYLKRAIQHYEKSAKIKRQLPYTKNTSLTNLANLYAKLDAHKEAEKYYEEVIAEGEKKNHLETLGEVYHFKLNDALNSGNIKEARYYLKKLDSVQGVSKKAQQEDFQSMMQNQFDLFDARNEQKQKEQALAEEKEKRQWVEKVHARTVVIFIVVIVLIAFILLYLVQYFKNNKLKGEREKIMLEQRILRSQMNPHFIFNVLSSIQNTLLENNPLQSASQISRFAKLIRQNFDFTNKEKITLEEDLSALTNYIETQKLRFADKFDYQIDVDDQIDIAEVEIPPMLIQPIVENAIEHGLKPKKEKGCLSIRIQARGNKLVFSIMDNGIGFRDKNKDGKVHSLGVLKTRLQLLGCKDENSLQITTPKAHSGTIVKFELTVL